MSKIGTQPIEISKNVTVEISPKNVITVKGPLGTLVNTIDRDIIIEIKDSILTVKRPTEQIRHKALHGLWRALIFNMVLGVTEGFKKQLELIGVGYKATNQGQLLDLSIGFSHNVIMEIPKEVKITTLQEKGKNPTIILESIDKQLLGSVASKIRSLRKPEPYKGKGIRYSDEFVRRKAGKSASGSGAKLF